MGLVQDMLLSFWVSYFHPIIANYMKHPMIHPLHTIVVLIYYFFPCSHILRCDLFQKTMADYDEDPEVDDLDGAEDPEDDEEEEEADDDAGEAEVELGSQDTDEDGEAGEEEGTY